MSFWFHCLDQNINEKFDKFCPRMGRAEFIKFFIGILVQTMKPKRHFEINWPLVRTCINLLHLYKLFAKFSDHSGVWPKVSLVFEDFRYKISEGKDQNWSFPVSALLAVLTKLRHPTGKGQENFNFACSLKGPQILQKL